MTESTVSGDGPSRGWAEQTDVLLRGISGGMLIGIPLLYTMEVWWIGSAASAGRLLLVLAVAFVGVFALHRLAGLREADRHDARTAAFDSVISFGLGIVAVTVVLVVLREVNGTTPAVEAVGRIVFEAIPFCVGVAVAGTLLKGSREGDDIGASGRDHDHPTLADVGATTIGAVFVAFNIAPTDEIPMLAASATPVSLLAVIALSLVISYAIMFEAGFSREEQRRQQQGILQHPLTETVGSYVVALVTAVLMLSLVGNLDVFGSWQDSLAQVVLLGFPAAIGGAAGRLAV